MKWTVQTAWDFVVDSVQKVGRACNGTGYIYMYLFSRRFTVMCMLFMWGSLPARRRLPHQKKETE